MSEIPSNSLPRSSQAAPQDQSWGDRLKSPAASPSSRTNAGSDQINESLRLERSIEANKIHSAGTATGYNPVESITRDAQMRL